MYNSRYGHADYPTAPPTFDFWVALRFLSETALDQFTVIPSSGKWVRFLRHRTVSVILGLHGRCHGLHEIRNVCVLGLFDLI